MRDLATIAIRPSQPRDESACRACVVDLQDSERSFDMRLRSGESMADEYLRQMHTRCEQHAGVILLAEQQGEVVGLVMVLTHVPYEALDEPPGAYALIAELVVRAHARGRGIGRALLEAGERYARESGATELRIRVLSDNRAARKLYLDDGFAPYLETLAKPLVATVATRAGQ